MTMHMHNDDDVYVVIIGNEEEIQKHEPIHIKQELLEEDDMQTMVEDLLKKAEEHGEVVEIEYDGNDDGYIIPADEIKVEIKTEDINNYDFEYAVDDEYIPFEDDALSNDDNISDSSGDTPQYKKRKKGSSTKSHSSFKSKSTDNSNPNTSDDDEPKERPRRKMLSSKERKSYVKELKQEHPELRNNKELLIDCLVEVMKRTKPPELPEDYYVMDGIMLECTTCHSTTESIPAAGRHYQEKHGVRYLHCFACGVDFRSKTNLYKHEKKCDSPDALVVLKARAKFLGRKGRSRPFLSDIAKEPPKKGPSAPRFQCGLCSATFRSKTGLQAHEHLHRGERPYLCPQCPRSYTSHTTLLRHKQTHGNQRYICDHCKREFKVKAALSLHMNTHELVKKHACKECSKRYSQKAALVLHVNRDHRKLPLPCACKLCPKRYPRMTVLKDHMRKVHGMVIMTRKMFFKKLPTLTDTQLQQAKVILKTDLDSTSSIMFDANGQIKEEIVS